MSTILCEVNEREIGEKEAWRRRMKTFQPNQKIMAFKEKENPKTRF